MAIIASASTSWLRSRDKGPDLEGKQVQAAIGCIYTIKISRLSNNSKYDRGSGC